MPMETERECERGNRERARERLRQEGEWVQGGVSAQWGWERWIPIPRGTSQEYKEPTRSGWPYSIRLPSFINAKAGSGAY